MVYGIALLGPEPKATQILRPHWLGPAAQGEAGRLCFALCSVLHFYIFSPGLFTLSSLANSSCYTATAAQTVVRAVLAPHLNTYLHYKQLYKQTL